MDFSPVAPRAFETASRAARLFWASAMIGENNRTEANRTIRVRMPDLPWDRRVGSVAEWLVGRDTATAARLCREVVLRHSLIVPRQTATPPGNTRGGLMALHP